MSRARLCQRDILKYTDTYDIAYFTALWNTFSFFVVWNCFCCNGAAKYYMSRVFFDYGRTSRKLSSTPPWVRNMYHQYQLPNWLYSVALDISLVILMMLLETILRSQSLWSVFWCRMVPLSLVGGGCENIDEGLIWDVEAPRYRVCCDFWFPFDDLGL